MRSGTLTREPQTLAVIWCRYPSQSVRNAGLQLRDASSLEYFSPVCLIYPGVGKRDIDSILNGYGWPQVQHLPLLLVGRTKCLSSRRWRRATGCSTSCLLPARRCRGRTICSPKVAHLAVRWHTRYTVLSFFTSAPSLIRHSVIARTVRTLSPGQLTA